jgi:putative transposase
VQRGHNRAATFGDDRDRWRFLDVVREACGRARLAVHAYVLMSNHVHLLATPEDEAGPHRFFEHIGRRYVRYFNWRYERSGSLWDGRYHSSLVDSTRYFLTCSRYIELNPVRAAMTAHPSEHRWSSYHHNAYGTPDELVSPHLVYAALGTTAAARQAEYRALFATHIDPVTTDQIRRAARTCDALGLASANGSRRKGQQRQGVREQADASHRLGWNLTRGSTAAIF